MFFQVRFVFSIISLFLVLGCSTTQRSASTVVIDEVKAPLRRIMQSAAYALPGGILKSSENRRVFKSRYIDLNGNRWDVLSKSKHRSSIEISILGDRRPYVIEVSAIVEERKSDSPLDQSFEEVGQSRKLAEKIAGKLANHLEDRRKRRNLIDEFRAF